MGRRTKHFFEVFNEGRSGPKAPTAPMQPITRAAPPLTRPVAREVTPTPPTSPPKRSLSLRLTRETAIITGILFAGLLFLSHVWGYHRGQSRRYGSPSRVARAGRGVSNEEPVYAGGSQSRALNVADATRSSGPVFYSLCVWQGARSAAERLQKELRRPNRSVYVLPLSKSQWWAVTVGEFDSTTTDEAKALKTEFQEKVYTNNKKEFERCYWVTVALKPKKK